MKVEFGPSTSDLTYHLTLSDNEAAAVVGALYEAVVTRLERTQNPTEEWRDLDWELVQLVVDGLSGAYSKAMMEFRTVYGDEAVDEYYAAYGLSEDIWEGLAEVTKADSWGEYLEYREMPHPS
jgi:hypothetical protein